MNKHILCVMDRANKTKEELRVNCKTAYDAAAVAVDVYAAAYAAADVADVAAADADADYIEYWLNKYFEVTGENREAYEKAIKDGEG